MTNSQFDVKSVIRGLLFLNALCDLCKVEEIAEIVEKDRENLYLCDDCFKNYQNNAEWIKNLE